MAAIALEMEFFLVRNQEGKYFRAKGFSGSGLTWVEKAQDAKVYTKLGQARSRVTFFANNYPQYGIPEIIQIHVVAGEVLVEEKRVKKAIKTKELKDLQYKKKQLEDLQKSTSRQVWDLQARQKQLKTEIEEIEARLT